MNTQTMMNRQNNSRVLSMQDKQNRVSILHASTAGLLILSMAVSTLFVITQF